jgi:GAF domain-containing protein
MAIVASSGTARDELPVGSHLKLESTMALTAVVRTGRPARVDSYSGASEFVNRRAQRVGISSAVAVPIMIGGSFWGSIAAGTDRERFPADAEHRMAEFT